ncbi:MAG: phosphoglucosamine mutase [Candidatus Bathyarchaeia archaeon]
MNAQSNFAKNSLIFSPSGVRGIVGKDLGPEEALRLSLCFGSMIPQGTVVLGRDTRPSGEMIQRLVAIGLMSTGHNVSILGVAPSPAIAFAVKKTGAVGGIIVSASHNPPSWNALKFLGQEGIALNEAQISALRNLYISDSFKEVPWTSLGEAHDLNLLDDYRKALISLVDVEAIRKARLFAVVDTGNGAGSLVTPKALEDSGCQVFPLNVELDGRFRRPIEPTRESLSDLTKKVVSLGADIGFAHDCDADRLVCVSEKGEVLGEDLTLALIVDQVLSKRKGGIVVINVASSMVFDDVAERYGAKVLRTRVGEAYVVEKMIETGAIVGGEGSCGGVILPDHLYTRDGILAALKIAEALAHLGRTASEVFEAFPRYYTARGKVPCSGGEAREVIEALKICHSEEKLDLTDGIKIIGEKEWVLVRPSGTEPILRVMAEAESPRRAEELCKDLLKEVLEILSRRLGK